VDAVQHGLASTASPSLNLANKVLTVNQYGVPPKQQQPGSGTPATADTPQGYCINDTTTALFNGQTGCWRLLFGGEPAHNEVISTPDSNDTRMQQVRYANGRLWGALDTALNPDAGPQRAGIAWYIINPSSAKTGKGAAPRAAPSRYPRLPGNDSPASPAHRCVVSEQAACGMRVSQLGSGVDRSPENERRAVWPVLAASRSGHPLWRAMFPPDAPVVRRARYGAVKRSSRSSSECLSLNSKAPDALGRGSDDPR
jgi:hypothetical protein